MKAKLFLILSLFSTLPLFSARSQTVVTFDDFRISDFSSVAITNGYHGLTWVNFFVLNGTMQKTNQPGAGYNYGMVSASNVAFNGFTYAAEIDSPGTNFDFLSAYFTGAFFSNLNIEVQGYSGTNLIYDRTLAASMTNATLFNLDYLDINRLTFDSFVGQLGNGGVRSQFAMDNFTFEFIPEPSSLLLTILGVVTLWGFRKRRTA